LKRNSHQDNKGEIEKEEETKQGSQITKTHNKAPPLPARKGEKKSQKRRTINRKDKNL